MVAVADAGPLLLGECKWSRRAVGVDVLDALKAKTPAVLADLPRQSREVQYALWSRSGFTPELTRRPPRCLIFLGRSAFITFLASFLPRHE